jgi:LPS O-antigen subunit length determinant protein (WzzB/FepE family)
MNNNSDEIELIELLKTAWSGRKQIIIISFVFVLVGVAAALLSPVVYSSSTTFINSQTESSSSSGLSGVASFVGINLGGISSGSEIPPTMYPQISESFEFKRSLLKSHIDQKKQITLEEFLSNNNSGVKKSLSSDNNKLFISEHEFVLFNKIEKIIAISVNQKDGFITITADMPNSEYAANTCINARDILQKTVIDNKIKSAKQKLEFSEKQLSEKRIEFEEVQNKLAYFNDSNLNLVTSSVINERDKLEAEFQIINAVMIELSKQVEQRKLQVSEDTPVFSIIKEASMPVTRSYPKRTQMVLIFGFIGLVASISYTLVKSPIAQILKEINS